MAADNTTALDAEFTAPAEPKKAAAKKVVDSDALSGKKVRLTIHKDPRPTAVKDVFLGLNGVGYLIKRGEEAIVPTELVGVLDDAVETLYEQQGDQLVARDVPAYAYSVKPL
jgi:hypothetical protein